MSLVDINLAKGHLRLDDGINEDDLVQAYLDAAEEAAKAYLNRSVYSSQDEVDAAIVAGEDRPMLVNSSFTAAVLYMVAAMYYAREDSASSTNQFPQESRRFLDPFRIGQGV